VQRLVTHRRRVTARRNLRVAFGGEELHAEIAELFQAIAAIDTRERLPTRLRAAASAKPSTVRDLLLLGLTFASGAVDAIAFLGLSKIFSAFMTGNLVFLGLGLAGATGIDLVRVAAALAAFAVGVYLAIRIVKPTKGSAIWPRRVTIALGVSMLAQAAFLGGWLVTSGRPSTSAGDLLIALSALALGMQSGAVMSLDVKGVFTTAATATLIMLMSDEAGWAKSSADRRRLAGVLVALVAGATAAGFLLLHARVYAPILPLVVTLIVVATASVGLKPDGRVAVDRSGDQPDDLLARRFRDRADSDSPTAA
jgi:uncharacterized membrane protein YoaK (UPF0700 family)